MNLRHLHFLQLVIEQGSFTAAARAAGVSQPAISHGMHQLQKAVASPLFERQGRRLLPTEAALRAAAAGRALSRQVEQLEAAPPTPGAREQLRVGLTASAALVCGPLLYSVWCAGRPRRRLTLHSADEGQLLRRLQASELDLVIAPRPRRFAGAGLHSELLYPIVPQVHGRRGHPLRQAGSLAALQGADWAAVGPSVGGPVDVLQEAFAVRGMAPAWVAVSCPDYASLLHLLACSDLLAVLPHPALLASAAPGQIAPLPLREALPRYDMQLFSAQRARPAVQAVMAGLRAALSGPGGPKMGPPRPL